MNIYKSIILAISLITIVQHFADFFIMFILKKLSVIEAKAENDNRNKRYDKSVDSNNNDEEILEVSDNTITFNILRNVSAISIFYLLLQNSINHMSINSFSLILILFLLNESFCNIIHNNSFNEEDDNIIATNFSILNIVSFILIFITIIAMLIV